MKISKKEYEKLIQEDLNFLNDKMKGYEFSPELDHIKLIICCSIDWYYPKCKDHNNCCYVEDDLKEGEQCLPTKGCFSS